MYRVKKIITKRKIFTVSIVLVIFVMSLGYAALSQYIELDGIASIDRSWIVKVTNITNAPTNSATSISSNYISNTVTLNANLPASNSTITYTITLENQGNIPAKLNNIEIIEDENTNITYEIAGVEEGETTLNPGETNTATVTIKYKEGVTNVGNTEKDLMLTFIYIDNSETSNTGGSSGGTTEEYEEFGIGDRVVLVDGTEWYVTKDSGSSEDKVALISLNPASNDGSVENGSYVKKVFDSDNTNEYDQFDSNNIGYFVKNTVETYIKNSINTNGGNATGTTARLLTKEEYEDLVKNGVPSWMEGSYWLMTKGSGNSVYCFINKIASPISTLTEGYQVRPVIITLKNNIIPVNLREQILEDNVEQTDGNIDFSKTSEEDGTSGLYYTNTNTENNGTTYYFRGAVSNNYVSFAGFYWRIIRINEDGSVRLIYQGAKSNAAESDATIGESAFNSSVNDNAYVGYMYGTPGSSTYQETHANINDSTIKQVLDTWYEENLLANYSTYLADSGFCGDRSIANESGLWYSSDTALGYKENITYYGVWNRLRNNKTPQFVCPQSNDLYTTSSNKKGNKALDYPIGLITADEVAYAGGVVDEANIDYYLNINYTYWIISSPSFTGPYASVWCVLSNGLLAGYGVGATYGTRPVINLKQDVVIYRGQGTVNNPYVVFIN